MCAFLDMIAHSEGTAGKGDDGYNVIVGGELFNTYADHPRILVHLRKDLASTAAGRYQLLKRYYDVYKKALNLPDFSPISQDLIAIQQIKECGAVGEIKTGHFNLSVNLCKHIWASLPGAGYGQHENGLEALQTAFLKAGGTLSEA